MFSILPLEANDISPVPASSSSLICLSIASPKSNLSPSLLNLQVWKLPVLFESVNVSRFALGSSTKEGSSVMMVSFNVWLMRPNRSYVLIPVSYRKQF